MQTHQQRVNLDAQNQVSAVWAVPDAFQPGQTAAVLEDALQPVQAPTHVHVIEGADHSFKVPKRSGRTAEEVLEEIAREMVAWIQRTNR
jgi:predicted alpha/beta-hydrolase family hydrolase